MIQEGKFSILRQIGFWFTSFDDNSPLPGDSIAKLGYAAMNQFDSPLLSMCALQGIANYQCKPCASSS